MEKVTRENLHDIRFLNSGALKVGGIEVRIVRMGFSGELRYEVHGPSEYADDVWIAL